MRLVRFKLVYTSMKVMLFVTNTTTVSLVPFPHTAIFTTLFDMFFVRCPTLQTIMKWPVCEECRSHRKGYDSLIRSEV
jgi:hypothetical protein